MFRLSHISIGKALFSTVKLKTNQAAAKRFHPIPDSPSFTFAKSGRNHNFAKKSVPRRIANRQPGITQGYQTMIMQKFGL